MKAALLVVVVLAGLVSSASANAGGPARLTIPALGIYNKPVGDGDSMLRYGPIWDPYVSARPGQNKPMVIAGHDVTPVLGYGAHGPFYNLVTLKRGSLVEIRWNKTLRIYRVRGPSAYHPESDNEVVVDRGVEAVWLYSCWPRYTHAGRQWIEADLIRVKKP